MKQKTVAAPTSAAAPQAETPAGTPAPQAPAAPVTEPSKEKKLVLDTNELRYDSLLTMEVALVDQLARDYAKSGQKVKEARDNYKDQTKAVGKVYCALEIRLNKGKELNLLPANKSLAEFIKDIAGERPPTHALTLKNAFGAYVKTGFITETDYDSNSNNCLEIAARIVDAVKGNLTHDAVGKAAAELKARTDKEAKTLRDILATVKPAKAMTAEEAVDAIHEIADAGHLVCVLPEIPDILAEMSEKDQKDAFIAFGRTLERIEKALGEKADAWIAEAQKATAPVTVAPGSASPTASETPAATPAAAPVAA